MRVCPVLKVQQQPAQHYLSQQLPWRSPPERQDTQPCTQSAMPGRTFCFQLSWSRQTHDQVSPAGSTSQQDLIAQLQSQLQQSTATPSKRKKAVQREAMVLLVLDELDALMSRDQSILIDLFRLPQVLAIAQPIPCSPNPRACEWRVSDVVHGQS